NPESVCVGPDGRVYVSVIGEFDKEGDGSVVVIDKGKAVPFVEGLDDPKGLVAFGPWLFVADRTKGYMIERDGKKSVLADTKAFDPAPRFLNDLAVDEGGTLYVSDTGDLKGNGGAVYRINIARNPRGVVTGVKVTLVADVKKAPALKAPNGLCMDS